MGDTKYTKVRMWQDHEGDGMGTHVRVNMDGFMNGGPGPGPTPEEYKDYDETNKTLFKTYLNGAGLPSNLTLSALNWDNQEYGPSSNEFKMGRMLQTKCTSNSPFKAIWYSGAKENVIFADVMAPSGNEVACCIGGYRYSFKFTPEGNVKMEKVYIGEGVKETVMWDEYFQNLVGAGTLLNNIVYPGASYNSGSTEFNKLKKIYDELKANGPFYGTWDKFTSGETEETVVVPMEMDATDATNCTFGMTIGNLSYGIVADDPTNPSKFDIRFSSDLRDSEEFSKIFKQINNAEYFLSQTTYSTTGVEYAPGTDAYKAALTIYNQIKGTKDAIQVPWSKKAVGSDTEIAIVSAAMDPSDTNGLTFGFAMGNRVYKYVFDAATPTKVKAYVSDVADDFRDSEVFFDTFQTIIGAPETNPFFMESIDFTKEGTEYAAGTTEYEYMKKFMDAMIQKNGAIYAALTSTQIDADNTEIICAPVQPTSAKSMECVFNGNRFRIVFDNTYTSSTKMTAYLVEEDFKRDSIIFNEQFQEVIGKNPEVNPWALLFPSYSNVGNAYPAASDEYKIPRELMLNHAGEVMMAPLYINSEFETEEICCVPIDVRGHEIRFSANGNEYVIKESADGMEMIYQIIPDARDNAEFNRNFQELITVTDDGVFLSSFTYTVAGKEYDESQLEYKIMDQIYRELITYGPQVTIPVSWNSFMNYHTNEVEYVIAEIGMDPLSPNPNTLSLNMGGRVYKYVFGEKEDGTKIVTMFVQDAQEDKRDSTEFDGIFQGIIEPLDGTHFELKPTIDQSFEPDAPEFTYFRKLQNAIENNTHVYGCYTTVQVDSTNTEIINTLITKYTGTIDQENVSYRMMFHIDGAEYYIDKCDDHGGHYDVYKVNNDTLWETKEEWKDFHEALAAYGLVDNGICLTSLGYIDDYTGEDRANRDAAALTFIEFIKNYGKPVPIVSTSSKVYPFAYPEAPVDTGAYYSWIYDGYFFYLSAEDDTVHGHTLDQAAKYDYINYDVCRSEGLSPVKRLCDLDGIAPFIKPGNVYYSYIEGLVHKVGLGPLTICYKKVPMDGLHDHYVLTTIRQTNEEFGEKTWQYTVGGMIYELRNGVDETGAQGFYVRRKPIEYCSDSYTILDSYRALIKDTSSDMRGVMGLSSMEYDPSGHKYLNDEPEYKVLAELMKHFGKIEQEEFYAIWDAGQDGYTEHKFNDKEIITTLLKLGDDTKSFVFNIVDDQYKVVYEEAEDRFLCYKVISNDKHDDERYYESYMDEYVTDKAMSDMLPPGEELKTYTADYPEFQVLKDVYLKTLYDKTFHLPYDKHTKADGSTVYVNTVAYNNFGDESYDTTGPRITYSIGADNYMIEFSKETGPAPIEECNKVIITKMISDEIHDHEQFAKLFQQQYNTDLYMVDFLDIMDTSKEYAFGTKQFTLARDLWNNYGTSFIPYMYLPYCKSTVNGKDEYVLVEYSTNALDTERTKAEIYYTLGADTYVIQFSAHAPTFSYEPIKVFRKAGDLHDDERYAKNFNAIYLDGADWYFGLGNLYDPLQTMPRVLTPDYGDDFTVLLKMFQDTDADHVIHAPLLKVQRNGNYEYITTEVTNIFPSPERPYFSAYWYYNGTKIMAVADSDDPEAVTKITLSKVTSEVKGDDERYFENIVTDFGYTLTLKEMIHPTISERYYTSGENEFKFLAKLFNADRNAIHAPYDVITRPTGEFEYVTTLMNTNRLFTSRTNAELYFEVGNLSYVAQFDTKDTADATKVTIKRIVSDKHDDERYADNYFELSEHHILLNEYTYSEEGTAIPKDTEKYNMIVNLLGVFEDGRYDGDEMFGVWNIRDKDQYDLVKLQYSGDWTAVEPWARVDFYEDLIHYRIEFNAANPLDELIKAYIVTPIPDASTYAEYYAAWLAMIDQRHMTNTLINHGAFIDNVIVYDRDANTYYNSAVCPCPVVHTEREGDPGSYYQYINNWFELCIQWESQYGTAHSQFMRGYGLPVLLSLPVPLQGTEWENNNPYKYGVWGHIAYDEETITFGDGDGYGTATIWKLTVEANTSTVVIYKDSRSTVNEYVIAIIPKGYGDDVTKLVDFYKYTAIDISIGQLFHDGTDLPYMFGLLSEGGQDADMYPNMYKTRRYTVHGGEPAEMDEYDRIEKMFNALKNKARMSVSDAYHGLFEVPMFVNSYGQGKNGNNYGSSTSMMNKRYTWVPAELDYGANGPGDGMVLTITLATGIYKASAIQGQDGYQVDIITAQDVGSPYLDTYLTWIDEVQKAMDGGVTGEGAKLFPSFHPDSLWISDSAVAGDGYPTSIFMYNAEGDYSEGFRSFLSIMARYYVPETGSQEEMDKLLRYFPMLKCHKTLYEAPSIDDLVFYPVVWTTVPEDDFGDSMACTLVSTFACNSMPGFMNMYPQYMMFYQETYNSSLYYKMCDKKDQY